MGRVIGIDLGTTNSVISFMDRQEPAVVVNEEGSRVTPSVVSLTNLEEKMEVLEKMFERTDIEYYAN